MGLFSADQLTEVSANTARVKQVWTLWRPEYSGGPAIFSIVIHNGEDLIRVTDAGSREAEAYNQTLQKPGDLRVNNYRFTLDNQDGYFNLGVEGTIWDAFTFIADPIQCVIEHLVYLEVNGVWEELEFLSFKGGVESIKYKSKNGVVYSATLTCNNSLMIKILNKIWDQGDGTETDLETVFSAEG